MTPALAALILLGVIVVAWAVVAAWIVAADARHVRYLSSLVEDARRELER